MFMLCFFRVGCDVQGDQGDAEVSDASEEAVQCCLVDHFAGEGGGSVALIGEGESSEPVAPTLIKPPVQADLVSVGFGIPVS
ncbi:hypothetical protein GCM10009777_39700 [Microbacterium pumilum]|uniref:Uncharacterized protein n=1 Tax=Microbacterium pumilum TaxID=344165 RepID=A0ABP5EH15_9MICO